MSSYRKKLSKQVFKENSLSSKLFIIQFQVSSKLFIIQLLYKDALCLYPDLYICTHDELAMTMYVRVIVSHIHVYANIFH